MGEYRIYAKSATEQHVQTAAGRTIAICATSSDAFDVMAALDAMRLLRALQDRLKDIAELVNEPIPLLERREPCQ